MSDTTFGVEHVIDRWRKSITVSLEAVFKYHDLPAIDRSAHRYLVSPGVDSLIVETLGWLPMETTISRKELVKLALTKLLVGFQLRREIRINLQKIWLPLVEYCASGSPDFNPVSLQLYDWIWAAVPHPYEIDNPGYYHVLGLDFVRYIDQDQVETIIQIQLNNVASRFQAMLA